MSGSPHGYIWIKFRIVPEAGNAQNGRARRGEGHRLHSCRTPGATVGMYHITYREPLAGRIAYGGDLESRDRRDQDDTLWHRFYDSIHKAQRDHNHPTETLKFIALALASLGELLQEAMRRKSNE